MAYVLNQYNKIDGVDDNIFMTLVTEPMTAAVRENPGDIGVTGTNIIKFSDECVHFEGENVVFDTEKSYYFHGKIQRMARWNQEFDIKLCYFNPAKTEDKLITQYITTINVEQGSADLWVDIDFIFTPLRGFDCILFELKRTSVDYINQIRIPIIAYEELSTIEDIIAKRIGPNVRLIKIGVQSRPGLMMCINHEGIMTNGTGIYELKNGIMTVNFFSVVNNAKETDSGMETWMNTLSNSISQLDNMQLSDQEYYQEKKEIVDGEGGRSASCYFRTSKTRQIDRFTLDYLYVKDI